MAPTTQHRTTLKAHLPGWPQLMLAAGVAGWCAVLATATMALQFQLVDWRVESRDLQRQLREAETRSAELESSLAYWQRAEHLKGSTAEVLGLAPLQPENAEEFKIDPERLKRWEAAIVAVESGNRKSREEDGLIGLTKIIARGDKAEEAAKKSMPKEKTPLAEEDSNTQ